MSNDKVTVRIESTHDCGYVFQQTVMHLDQDALFSFAVKPDPPFHFHKEPYVVAGLYTLPPSYKTKIELVAHCNKLEINGLELRDDRLVCPKCGADILFPDREEQAE